MLIKSEQLKALKHIFNQAQQSNHVMTHFKDIEAEHENKLIARVADEIQTVPPGVRLLAKV